MNFLHFIAEWLDRSPFARIWQLAKWRLKYFVGRVPAFATQIEQPHRGLLCKAILETGARTVLEIGCGRAPNLYLLWRADPQLELIGLDPSRTVIKAAREELKRRGAGQVRLEVGADDGLRRQADSRADLLMADAVLMYIPPDAIAATLADMLRVARIGIVLSTWHMDMHEEDRSSRGANVRYNEETWIYDYRRLLAAHPDVSVEITPYPSDAWQDVRWNNYGVVIRALRRQ